MPKLLKTWKFGFDSGLDVRSVHLAGGPVVPLPPRKLWSADADGAASLIEQEDGSKNLAVVLTKAKQVGKTTKSSDFTSWLFKAGIDKITEKCIEHVGETVLGVGIGLSAAFVTPVVATATILLMPKEIATQSFWQFGTVDGATVTVVLIGF